MRPRRGSSFFLRVRFRTSLSFLGHRRRLRFAPKGLYSLERDFTLLTPLEVSHSTLTTLLDRLKRFMRISEASLLSCFLRHRVLLASVILPSASFYVSTCLFGALTIFAHSRSPHAFCFLLHRDSLASNILPSIYLYVYYLTYFLQTSQEVRSAWASAFLHTKNESGVKSCLLPVVTDRIFFTH